MQEFWVTLLLIVGVLATVKTVAAVTTPLWIYQYGEEYLKNLKGTEMAVAAQEIEYWQLLDRNHGKIFPFGIRAYRLLRFREDGSGKGLPRRAIGLLVLLFHRVFNMAGIVPLCCISLVMASIVVPHRGIVQWTTVVICAEIASWPILVAMESAISYAKMGSYGSAYYRPGLYLEQKGRGLLLIEVLWLAFAIVCAYLSDVAIYFNLSESWHSFRELQLYHHSPTGYLELLGNAAYYVLSNFTTGGDAQAHGFLGKFFTAAILVQGVAFIVLILGALTSMPSITLEEAGSSKAPASTGSAPAQAVSTPDRSRSIATPETRAAQARNVSGQWVPRIAFVGVLVTVVTFIWSRRVRSLPDNDRQRR